jgi:hypothetical protein
MAGLQNGLSIAWSNTANRQGRITEIMLKVLFTLDYEIHGNGDGCPYALMVEPTDRMLRQFERYGAKLTIMADIAEILRFREYAEEHGQDDFHYARIAAQLQDAVRRGHDVQLHVHASYFNAQFKNRRWEQDWSEYNFAGLPLQRLNEIVRLGRRYLEDLLQPVKPGYRCIAFRAANWAVNPSRNVVRALVNNDIRIDTSVFKYGRRDTLVHFDYSSAHSSALPWRVGENDICVPDPSGQLVEFPIYSERRSVGAFITPQRIYRLFLSRLHRLNRGRNSGPADQSLAKRSKRNGMSRTRGLNRKFAWKADFNQCSGRQLIGALRRAEADYGTSGTAVPFVLIGHSKLFTRFNQWSLAPFLSFVAEQGSRFCFATFADFDLQHFDGGWQPVFADPPSQPTPSVCVA